MTDTTSAWSPFHHRAFAVLQTATVISNIGTWMQSAAAGWLMTGLDPRPLSVALVQMATVLPMFLLAVPAGAVADIVDRRRLLLSVQIAATVIIAALALLVGWHRVTPPVLLLLTGALGVTAALIAPTWQAIVPQLKPRADTARGSQRLSQGDGQAASGTAPRRRL